MHFIDKAFLKKHATNTSKGVTQEQCPVGLLITFFLVYSISNIIVP